MRELDYWTYMLFPLFLSFLSSPSCFFLGFQSPTTCANVGLYNMDKLLPNEKPETFDLVVSGPNYGRNTGTAFALGSGTIGAALAASLSGTMAISLSYGHFQFPTEAMKLAEAQYKAKEEGDKKKNISMNSPPSAPQEVIVLAHELSCRIISKLFNEWEQGVAVYTINVPLSYILKEQIVYWTHVWQSRYGQLFKIGDIDSSKSSDRIHLPSSAPTPNQELRFGPNMAGMLQPKAPTEGSDIWALVNGYVSVSRLEARYAEVPSSKSNQGRFKL